MQACLSITQEKLHENNEKKENDYFGMNGSDVRSKGVSHDLRMDEINIKHWGLKGTAYITTLKHKLDNLLNI